MARPGMMGPLALGAGLGMLASNTRRPYAYGPPTVGAGLGQGLQTALTMHAALNQPARAPKTRMLPLGGGKEQMQQWDGTQWVNQGKPRNIWQPRQPRRPRIFTVQEGDENVTYSMDDAGRKEIGRGPAWKPEAAGEQYPPVFTGVDPKRALTTQAWMKIGQLREKELREEPFTARDREELELAYTIVNEPQIRFDPISGKAYAKRPEIPAWVRRIGAEDEAPAPAAPTPRPTVGGMDEAPAPAAAPAAAPAPKQPPLIEEIDVTQGRAERKVRQSLSKAREHIEQIGKLLAKGKQTKDSLSRLPGMGEIGTGIGGYVRREYGGLIRQLTPLEVDTTAAELGRAYTNLGFVLTPILTEEANRFSGSERDLVYKVIGDLEKPAADLVDVQASMRDLIRVLRMIEDSYGNVE